MQLKEKREEIEKEREENRKTTLDITKKHNAEIKDLKNEICMLNSKYDSNEKLNSKIVVLNIEIAKLRNQILKVKEDSNYVVETKEKEKKLIKDDLRNKMEKEIEKNKAEYLAIKNEQLDMVLYYLDNKNGPITK